MLTGKGEGGDSPRSSAHPGGLGKRHGAGVPILGGDAIRLQDREGG